MVRVPDWSESEFEGRAAALARLIRRAWRAVARLVAGHVERQAVVTGADANKLPDAWASEVEAALLGYVTDTYLDAAGKVRAALDAPDDLLLTDDLATAYLRTARNRLRGIGDDVWQVVSAQLIQGVSAGESVPELAARVRATAGVSDARSLTIARTEVHAAHEAGSYDQALFVDPDATKIWLATNDERTRETHRAAEGQRRRLSEPFEVGGTQLRYPGDPLGAADEVINCRCSTVYDFGTVDLVPSDAENPELALVAAVKKKWTPSKHPRGADGRFIKKGAIVDFLAKPKPDIPSLSKAVNELTVGSWGKLTDAQKEYFEDAVAKLPQDSPFVQKLDQKLAEMKIEDALVKQAEAKLAEKGVQLAPVTEPAPAAKTSLPPSSPSAPVVETSTGTKIAKPVSDKGNVIKVGFLLPDGSISAHKGAEPGTMAKVTNYVLWGQYPAGTTILESPDGTQRVTWNGKKYDWFVGDEVKASASKGAMYKLVKGDDAPAWVVPKREGQPTDAPEVLKPDVETAPEPAPAPAVAETPEEPAAPTLEPVVEPEIAPTPVEEPEPEPEPDLLQELMDAVPEAPQVEPSTASEDKIQKLLDQLKLTGEITTAEAVQLGLGMTQSEWDGLTANQRAKIVLGTDLALDKNSIDEGDAYLAFGHVQNLQANGAPPVPEPSPATKIDEPEIYTPSISEQEWKGLADNADEGLYPGGTVVAETSDGEFMLVKGHTWNTWYIKDFNGETENTYTDADIEGGQVVTDKPFHEWQLTPAATPDVSEPEPEPEPGPEPEPSTFGAGGEIESEEEWLDLFDSFAAIDESVVVAQTGNGSYRMVAHPDGSATLEWNVADKWIDIETFNPQALEDIESITDLVQSHTAMSWLKTEPTTIISETPTVSEAIVPEVALLFGAKPAGDLSDAQLVDYAEHFHALGAVVALNNAENFRVLVTDPGSSEPYTLQTREDADSPWEDSYTLSPGTLALTLNEGTGWFLPADPLENALPNFEQEAAAPAPAPPGPAPATTLTPSLPLSGPGSLSTSKTDAQLDAYTAFDHPVGTIAATYGKQQLVYEGSNGYVLQAPNPDGELVDAAHLTDNLAAELLKENAWVVPDNAFTQAVAPSPAAASTQLGAPTIELGSSTQFQTVESLTNTEKIEYVASEHPPGTIVGFTITPQGVSERLVATGLPSPRYKKQRFEKLAWVDVDDYGLSGSEVKHELDGGGWLLPQPALTAVKLFLTSFDEGEKTDAPAPSPAVGVVDTSTIPQSSKEQWKKQFTAAKVGYWSDPKKVWDQVQKILAQYPDPEKPGHSKLTPLQVLKSLDDLYLGLQDKPYETKMIKWAATAEGKAYTGNTGNTGVGAVNVSATTQTSTPAAPQLLENKPANVEKLWNTLSDLDDGTVLATVSAPGTNGTTVHYRFVVDTEQASGKKLPKLEYRNSAAETAWQGSVHIQHLYGWHSVLEKGISGNPWKLSAVQQPVGGVPAATTPATPAVPGSVPLTNTDANAGKVWLALDNLPDGTVVATNPGGKYGTYQMVVASAEGKKQVLIQSKKPDQLGGDWKTQYSVEHVVDFQDTMTDLMGGNPWSFTVGESDLGGAVPTPSAAPGPPVPKPFKMTVKQIYAAMPTLQQGKPVAYGEVNGVKYALIPGYGFTKSFKLSKKKKLILKKQTPSGAWTQVQPLDTQPKLKAVLDDPSYGWVVPEDTPPIPPPSVSAPVAAPKPTPTVPAPAADTYASTSDDLAQLWNDLDNFDTGSTIAVGTFQGGPAKLTVGTGPQGKRIILETSHGKQLYADDQSTLISKLSGDTAWKITASKSPISGASDIAHLSPDKKQSLYTEFKGKPNTYLNSEVKDIFKALKSVADSNGLSLLQMIRVVDEVGAQKVNAANTHLFEAKVKEWLATPKGAAIAAGKPVPLPPTPAYKAGYGPENLPSLEQSNGLDYKILTIPDAEQLWSDIVAKSAPWTSTEESNLKAYTSNLAFSLNSYLYGKSDTISDTNAKVAKYSQLGMRPSTRPVLLHRGVAYDGIGDSSSHADIEKLVGQTWKSGGFFSTSVGGKAGFSGYPVHIEVEAPPGTPMAYLEPISYFKGGSEKEVLLGAGLHYKILNVQLKNGKTVVRVRVVPEPEEG